MPISNVTIQQKSEYGLKDTKQEDIYAYFGGYNPTKLGVWFKRIIKALDEAYLIRRYNPTKIGVWFKS